VIASNRGPLSFSFDDSGQLQTKRGGGGLVSSLGPAVEGTGATWVAAAITPADREATGRGIVEAEGFRLRSLAIDPDEYRMFYDVIANGTLWFLFHRLWDLPRRPRFDARWREAWVAFRSVNQTFAAAVAEEAPEGATVLVHDYHLPLVGGLLADKRPDVRSVYFNHTPFCTADEIGILPDDVAVELLEGLAGNRACGFHTRRWAASFEDCCRRLLGRVPATYVAPPAPDPDDFRSTVESETSQRAFEKLDREVGDRAFLVRVDRIELSKNVLRGFHAYDELLRTRPEWRERVVFGAYVYPSREGLAEYLAYRQEVESLVRRLNEKWATPGWTPILLEMTDDFPRSVAALRRSDVLLVNPVRDGLNLVALEGPLVNERDGVLVLSREAGIAEHIGDRALLVNPYDIAGTADAIDRALRMSAEERRAHHHALKAAALARTPQDWLDDQLAAAAG